MNRSVLCSENGKKIYKIEKMARNAQKMGKKVLLNFFLIVGMMGGKNANGTKLMNH